MGKLEQYDEDLLVYTIDDFSGGIAAIGNPDENLASNNIPEEPGFFLEYQGFTSNNMPGTRGLAEPIIGDREYNDPNLSVDRIRKTSAPTYDGKLYINGLFPYKRVVGGNVDSREERIVTYADPTGTPLYDALTLVPRFGLGQKHYYPLPRTPFFGRRAVQVGAFLFIATPGQKLYRFCDSSEFPLVDPDAANNNFVTGATSENDTPAPGSTKDGSGTYNPYANTAAGAAAGGLTPTFLYKYRVALEYGLNGELGMGWIESSQGTFAPNGSMIVTLPTTIPAGTKHCKWVSIYRNTESTQDNFFQVARVALGTASITDVLTDQAIRGVNQTYPINKNKTITIAGGGGTTCPASEFLAPIVDSVVYMDSKLWMSGYVERLASGGLVHHANRVAFTRHDGTTPRYGQISELDFVDVGGIEDGVITGLCKYQNNVWALTNRGVFARSQDAIPGRVPYFAPMVSGVGCLSRRGYCVTPYGIAIWTATGLQIITGSPEPAKVSERIAGKIAPSSQPPAFLAADPKGVVLGWNPATEMIECSIGITDADNVSPGYSEAGALLLSYSPSRDRWESPVDEGYVAGELGRIVSNARWTAAQQFDGELDYTLAPSAGVAASFYGSGDVSQYVYRRSMRTRYDASPGEGMLNEPIARKLRSKFYDFGKPETQKRLRWFDVEFTTQPTPTPFITHSLDVYLYVDGNVVTNILTGNSGPYVVNETALLSRQFRLSIPQDTCHFHTIAFKLDGRSADVEQESATLPGDAIIARIRFVHQDDGRVVEGVLV